MTKYHSTSIRMPTEQRKQIEKLAKAEKRSNSNMIVLLIDEALKTRKTKRR